MRINDNWRNQEQNWRGRVEERTEKHEVPLVGPCVTHEWQPVVTHAWHTFQDIKARSRMTRMQRFQTGPRRPRQTWFVFLDLSIPSEGEKVRRWAMATAPLRKFANPSVLKPRSQNTAHHGLKAQTQEGEQRDWKSRQDRGTATPGEPLNIMNSCSGQEKIRSIGRGIDRDWFWNAPKCVFSFCGSRRPWIVWSRSVTGLQLAVVSSCLNESCTNSLSIARPRFYHSPLLLEVDRSLPYLHSSISVFRTTSADYLPRQSWR